MPTFDPTPDREPIEGQEVRLTPNDPVSAEPASVLAHLRKLILEAKARKREPVKLVSIEAANDVNDPVVASALVQADDELAELENDFAKEAERRKHAPSPAESQPNREHVTAESLIEALREAAEEGIEFEIDLDVEAE